MSLQSWGKPDTCSAPASSRATFPFRRRGGTRQSRAEAIGQYQKLSTTSITIPIPTTSAASAMGSCSSQCPPSTRMTQRQSQKTEAAICDGPPGSTPWFSVTGATVNRMMAARCFRSISIPFRGRSFVLRAGDVSTILHTSSQCLPRRNPNAAPSPVGRPAMLHRRPAYANCLVVGVCIIMPRTTKQSGEAVAVRGMTIWTCGF
jgi:hypothetical protein